MAVTTSLNGGAGHFRVVYSKRVLKALSGLLTKARALGKFDEFAAAVRKIHGSLQTQPFIFGEPIYTLPNLALRTRKGSVRPLVVTYSVDEERRLVYVVQPLTPLPSSGL
jgi:hypothetical protein